MKWEELITEYAEYRKRDKHSLPWDIWLKYKKKARIKNESQIFICPIQNDYEALIEDRPQCETCINYGVEFTDDDSFDTCLANECHYEPKTEPQTGRSE